MKLLQLTEAELGPAIAQLRKAREEITALERALGFDWQAAWQPMSFEGLIKPAETTTVISRSQYNDKPKALVVHGRAKAFLLHEAWVGTSLELGDPTRIGPGLPCEMFAYDNPPRTLDGWSMIHSSQDVKLVVQNLTGANEVFRATIWCERL
jgi:hypothetical protein